MDWSLFIMILNIIDEIMDSPIGDIIRQHGKRRE
jgi:hypothetical protein